MSLIVRNEEEIRSLLSSGVLTLEEHVDFEPLPTWVKEEGSEKARPTGPQATIAPFGVRNPSPDQLLPLWELPVRRWDLVFSKMKRVDDSLIFASHERPMISEILEDSLDI